MSLVVLSILLCYISSSTADAVWGDSPVDIPTRQVANQSSITKAPWHHVNNDDQWGQAHGSLDSSHGSMDVGDDSNWGNAQGVWGEPVNPDGGNVETGQGGSWDTGHGNWGDPVHISTNKPSSYIPGPEVTHNGWFVENSAGTTILYDTTTEADVNMESTKCEGILATAGRCGLCDCCYRSDIVKATCRGPNITDVPTDLPANLTHLTISHSNIVTLGGYRETPNSWPSAKFEIYPRLKQILLSHNSMLEEIEVGAFHFREESQLESVAIKNSQKRKKYRLGVLGAFWKLRTITILHCGIGKVPDWNMFYPGKNKLTSMELIDIDVQEVVAGSFPYTFETGELKFTHNKKLETIRDYAFNGSNIGSLDLSHNTHLTHLEPRAFANIKSFFKLDLSNTAIQNLPFHGLHSVQFLRIEGTPSLQTFVSVLHLRGIKEAKLTYQHHCCAFAFPKRQDPDLYESSLREMLNDPECATTTSAPHMITTAIMSTMVKRHGEQIGSNSGQTKSRQTRNLSQKMFEDARDKRKVDDSWHLSTINPFQNHSLRFSCHYEFIQYLKDVPCSPEPDPFNPCEDVLGTVWLRAICWFIVITAIFGNVAVIIVTFGNMIVTKRNKSQMNVSYFLIFNLALSDLLLGLYLGVLAAFDLHSRDRYFTFAIPWQNNGGCQIAGFLATLATCSSVFTLTVITVERWYAIRNALDINKRIRGQTASIIMTCGWAYSTVMALLPIVGISSYSKTSICLPMETTRPVDLGYVFTLMLINAGCFFLICFCYGNIYRRVHSGSAPAGYNDITIAKRMLLLVATDFACLSPIVFFGITAAAGLPLIDLPNSKILLVICFPLNSCANPFLYAIKTKHFRRELLEMLSRNGFCEKRVAKYRLAQNSTPMSYSQSRGSLSGTQNMIHRPSVGSTTFTSCLMDSNGKGSKGSLSNMSGNHSHTPQITKQITLESYIEPSNAISVSSVSDTPLPPAESTLTCDRLSEARKLSVVLEGSMASGVSDNDSQYDSAERPTDKSDNSQYDSSHDDINKHACVRVRSVSEYSEKIPFKYPKNHEYLDLETKGRKGSEATCLTDLSDFSSNDNTLKSNSSMDTNESLGRLHGPNKQPFHREAKKSFPGDSGIADVHDPQEQCGLLTEDEEIQSDNVAGDVFESLNRQMSRVASEKTHDKKRKQKRKLNAAESLPIQPTYHRVGDNPSYDTTGERVCGDTNGMYSCTVGGTAVSYSPNTAQYSVI